MSEYESQSFSASLAAELIHQKVSTSSRNAAPHPDLVAKSILAIQSSLTEEGMGSHDSLTHLLRDLTPGFNGHKLSANYYGFVVGGVLPIAEAADNIVSAWDQNVQVNHLQESVCVAVEDATLDMLCDLLAFDDGRWKGRTFTTGATGSNILGLACGRESVIAKRLEKIGHSGDSGAEKPGVGELGMLAACKLAGIHSIQVLTAMAHSSVYKAASVVGIGRSSVKDIGLKDQPCKFDLERLERSLAEEGVASIVVISCGEVNTGKFTTESLGEVQAIRKLCDTYGAWLHADGAFAIFSRALPKTEEFSYLRQCCDGMELVDSIAGDGHKSLNVPYDCGFFLTTLSTTLLAVFHNPNAAYLSGNSGVIPSPLNIGMENSRRFRALPVYASLNALGRLGYSDIFQRQVRLARLVANYVEAHPGLELLPRKADGERYGEEKTGTIVLFRAKDEKYNQDLVKKINDGLKIFVSGTVWEGKPAARIAVSTYQVDENRDLEMVKEAVDRVFA